MNLDCLEGYDHYVRCDRCGVLTAVRARSFLNEDTLCVSCFGREAELKRRLRDAGIDPESMARHGVVPHIRIQTAGASPNALRHRPSAVRSSSMRRPGVRQITVGDLRAALRRLRARSALARIGAGPDVAGRGLPPAN